MAATVARVRPWKAFSTQTMRNAPSRWRCPHLRAILIAPSLASAPLLQKKTRAGKAVPTSRRAASTIGSL